MESVIKAILDDAVMKQTSVISIVAVAIIVIAAVAVLVMNNGDDGPDIDPTKDFAGMDIVPVGDLDDGIVAIGQDSFRWVTYFGLADRCVMVDRNDSTNYMGKSFMYVGKAQALMVDPDLKYTSTNCGITPADVSTIINLDPSLVVVPAQFEQSYPLEMKALREAGLNIFHIGYIYTFLENGTFRMTSDLVKQIDDLSLVLNMQDRGQELKDLIDGTVSDILSIRDRITEMRTGYIGALAYNGAHGVDSSMTYYMPFELAGITNIMLSDSETADKDSHVGTYSATDISKGIRDDTILFLDATGIYTCTTNTDRGILELFEGHEAYVACPYIWTGMNYENVLVGAYQILHDAYGLLTDEELEQRIDAVYRGFLGTSESLRNEVVSGIPVPETGTSVYDDMNNLYEGRRGNPIHGAISVGSEGIVYLS